MALTAATIQTQTNINQDYYNRQRWERKRIAITSDLVNSIYEEKKNIE